MNIPDKWIVLKIGQDIYKVFGTWYGGYLDGDSWKMNSGIVKVTEDEHNFIFHGYSGSTYICSKSENTYGTNSYSSGILNNILKKAKDNNVDVEIMDQNTNWLNLIK